jgi:hypothetical protein
VWYFEVIYDSKKAEELKAKLKRYWEPPTPVFVAVNVNTKKPVTTMRIPQGLPLVNFEIFSITRSDTQECSKTRNP